MFARRFSLPTLLSTLPLAALLALTAGPAGAAAAVPHLEFAVPAGTTSSAVQGLALRSGSLTAATGEDFSSPAVGDVTGDGVPDIVAGYPDGTIHVWNALTGGSELVIDTGPGAVESSPTLVDLYGQGLDILAGNTAGQVFVYNGAGQRLFFRQLPVSNSNLTGVFATPTVADLDHNGRPWIVVSSWNQNLYAFNLAGQVHPGFPVWFEDTSWSSPTIAYLDGTGYPDIVVGYDCIGIGGDYCDLTYHRGGGYLTVIDHNGHTLPGWPRFLPGQTIWSTPAVGDLTGNGTQDIVVGTGLFWPSPAGAEVLAFDPHGNLLPGWPVRVGGRVMASPALGHVVSSRYLSIAVTAEDGRTYLLDPNGTIRWSHCAMVTTTGCPQSHDSPILADVLGTGSPQVISATGNGWTAYSGQGTLLASAQIPQTRSLSAAATAVNLGGHANLLFASELNGPGYGTASVARYQFSTALGPAPWPTFKHDLGRSGNAAGPPVPPVGAPAAAQQAWLTAAAASVLGAPWDPADVAGAVVGLHELTVTRAQVVAQLQASAAAARRQVQAAYWRLLGRAATARESAIWVARLRAGTSVEQLRATLAGGPEYHRLAGPGARALVARDYQLFLGRPADAPGLAAWSGALGRGMSPQALAAGLQASSGGVALRVRQAYLRVLGRPVDPGALAAWSTALAHGATLLGLQDALVASGEFYARSQRS